MAEILIVLNKNKLPSGEIAKRLKRKNGSVQRLLKTLVKAELLIKDLVNSSILREFPASNYVHSNTQYVYSVNVRKLLELPFFHSPKTTKDGAEFLQKVEPVFESLLYEFLEICWYQRIKFQEKQRKPNVIELAQFFPSYLSQNHKYFGTEWKKAINVYIKAYLDNCTGFVFDREIVYSQLKKSDDRLNKN